jgi:hypothetical protein
VSSVKASDDPPIAVKPTATLDGIAEVADVQVLAHAVEAAPGTFLTVGPGAAQGKMPAADYTPPAVQLAKGGFDVIAGEITVIAAANTTRDKIDVLVDQAEDSISAAGRVRVWLSCGATDPEVGKGGFLRPDGAWSEYTQQQDRVIADIACRVTFVEWGKA